MYDGRTKKKRSERIHYENTVDKAHNYTNSAVVRLNWWSCERVKFVHLKGIMQNGKTKQKHTHLLTVSERHKKRNIKLRLNSSRLWHLNAVCSLYKCLNIPKKIETQTRIENRQQRWHQEKKNKSDGSNTNSMISCNRSQTKTKHSTKKSWHRPERNKNDRRE